MAHFRENPSERSAWGPWNRTKFSVRFRLAGSSLPMWPCASAVWDCRTPHQLLLFLSLLQLCHRFRDRWALQRRFRLLQYVLQLRTPGYYETIDLSLVSWESLKKCFLFVESRGWRGEGKRKRKTTSRDINVKVVFLLLCPLPIHPSLSTLPRVKQFCCCLVDYQSRLALRYKASQGKKKKDVLPRQDHFVTLWLESNRVSAKIFLKVPSRFAIGTGRTENEPENQFSVCRTNFRFAHVRVYFDPVRSKPWRGPFRKSNRIRFAKPPYLKLVGYFLSISYKVTLFYAGQSTSTIVRCLRVNWPTHDWPRLP